MFNIFQNKGLVDADQKMQNFYHVGQGDKLPMGGQSLTITDSVYDLGSDSYRWNNVYCNLMYANGEVQNTWNLLFETLVSATTSRIEISGLNGDEDKIYMILCNIHANTATNQFFMAINGDTSTNYGYQNIQAISSSFSGVRDKTETSLIIGYNTLITSTSHLSFSKNYLYAISGRERLIINKLLERSVANYIYGLFNYASIWNNTIDTITSLVFYPSTDYFYTGTNIQIWGIR